MGADVNPAFRRRANSPAIVALQSPVMTRARPSPGNCWAKSLASAAALSGFLSKRMTWPKGGWQAMARRAQPSIHSRVSGGDRLNVRLHADQRSDQSALHH
jgi:hypothetical protein